MKLSLRILSFVLAALLSFAVFAGCNSEQSGATQNTSATDAPTEPPQTTTEPTAPAEPTEPEVVERDIEITADNASEYTLIIPTGATNLLSVAAIEFNETVSAALGAGFALTYDSSGEAEKEIVVGRTSREFSEALTDDLRRQEFGISVKGEKIYIFGYNDLYVKEALEYFAENYINKDSKKINLKNDHSFYRSPYLLKEVTVDGVDIKDYTIIIPEDADLLTEYAAENLSDYFRSNGIGALTVSRDTEQETKYEILIGDTNREESKVSVTSGDGEYILYKNGDKIVCLGENIWVGGGAGAIIGRLPSGGCRNVVDITDIPTEPVAKRFEFKEAKNAILMIGDGMGFNTVEMFKADKNTDFYAEYLTNIGNAYTGSWNTAQDSSVPTDSAAGGTALSSGYKTKNGYIGVNRNNESKPNIRELAHEKGANTAVITTDVITGATPGAFLVHHNNRNDTEKIQELINNLIKYKGIDFAKGSVGNNLQKQTANILTSLSQNGSSFFAMIEEAHIDKRSHANDREGCVKMTERFNEAIAYVIEFVICHPDTVLIITADHETGGITKQSNGSFEYTTGSHSTQNVPVYSFGYGTECFDGKEVDNTEIAKFMLKIYGAVDFGS